MAIWQFSCNIVPYRKNIMALTANEIISWKESSIPLPEINFLEQKASWSKDIIQYGNIDETCIEFIYDNTLEEIFCRLDLRNLTKKQLNSIVEYVQNLGAMFFVDGIVYEPKNDIIISLLRNSYAFKYCQNSNEYLKSIEIK